MFLVEKTDRWAFREQKNEFGWSDKLILNFADKPFDCVIIINNAI